MDTIRSQKRKMKKNNYGDLDPAKYDIQVARWTTDAKLDMLIVLIPWDEFDHPLARTAHKTVLDRLHTPYKLISKSPDDEIKESDDFPVIWKHEVERGLDIKSLRFYPMSVDGDVLPRALLS